MTKMQTYTVGMFRPGYGYKRRVDYVVSHGPLTANRDTLPPTIVWVTEVQATSGKAALRLAKSRPGGR